METGLEEKGWESSGGRIGNGKEAPVCLERRSVVGNHP